MRYAIRKLEGNFWMDVLQVDTDRQLVASDTATLVEDKLASGELPLFSKSVFCVVQRLNNGREKRIGDDVCVDRNGQVLSGGDAARQ